MITRLATWIGTIIQRCLIWMVWNIPMGRLAPYVMGLALGKPKRIEGDDDT